MKALSSEKETLSRFDSTTSHMNGPVVVVSSDTHVGPRLREDLRAYCPIRYLDDFDDYVGREAVYKNAMREATPDLFADAPNGQTVRGYGNPTEGHYEIGARLSDMDADGIAAEVIFHGSQNDQPIPFTNLGKPTSPMIIKNHVPEDAEMAGLGRHIYNEWLADFCTVQPERHVGLAQLPIWDVDASVREVRWAHDAGLKGINFPAPQAWLPEYNKPDWDPLWRVAQDLNMPIVTHLGGGGEADYSGPEGRLIATLEFAFFGTRALPWMVFGGVFERYPELKLVITEVPGEWWPRLVSDLDSIYRMAKRDPLRGYGSDFFNKCPRMPSEYCRSNVFIGASFMSKAEAEAAFRDDEVSTYMWGSDYPHAEGTFHGSDEAGGAQVTHLALRATFSSLPPEASRMMIGLNAIEVYGLDGRKLEDLAGRINAPDISTLAEPLVDYPPEIRSLAFRRQGTWD
jgi:predicted TIM-barrel fold metal-dependent hydrolase